MGDSPIETICREVSSKCASLRAAARLLPELSERDSAEILSLMTVQAADLAKSLEKHREKPPAK